MTLCIGLVSSVFTAVVGTRVVYDYLLSRAAPADCEHLTCWKSSLPDTKFDFVGFRNTALPSHWS